MLVIDQVISHQRTGCTTHCATSQHLDTSMCWDVSCRHEQVAQLAANHMLCNLFVSWILVRENMTYFIILFYFILLLVFNVKH